MFQPTIAVIGFGVILTTAACTTAAPATATQATAPTPAPKPSSPPAVSASPSVAGSSSASPVAVASPSPAGVVPTASVVASPALQATVSASPAVVSPSPSPAASANVTGLRLVAVQPGPADSTVTVENDGATANDLSGWSLVVGTVVMRLPANARVEPGGRLVLHTGSGTSTGQDVYLSQDVASLAAAVRPGAMVALRDANGITVTQMTIP
jgi:hypothetical protein